MVVKLTNQGDWLFSGYISKNAAVKTVGEKNTPVCEFSVNCGKKDNGDAIFINCKAWRDLAGVFSELMKGDSFCGIGREKKREYNGKTYTDIELEWGNSPMLCGGPAEPEQAAPKPASYASASPDPSWSSMEDVGGELPF